MKHWNITLVGVVLAVFFFGTNALTRQEDAGQQNALPVVDPTDPGYLREGPIHKLFIGVDDIELYNELSSLGAIIDEIDYGSFKLVRVNEEAAGGRQRLATLLPRDEQDFINLNGFVFDPGSADSLASTLPGELRQNDMALSLATGAQPRGGLYVIQFAGPIKDSWIQQLKSTGAEIVSYVASNAYVVRANRSAARALPSFKAANSFVQFLGDYEPAFRMSPGVRAAHLSSNEELVDITVQVVSGAGDRRTLRRLREMAAADSTVNEVLKYHNVELSVPASRLAEVARLDNVFAVEERGVKRRLDEAQGQILAGSLSGNIPTGPGYLSFLATAGFNSTQFGSFVVEVVDDATSITGHPDLPTSRAVFQNNPTGQTGAQGGHGFLNTHIIGGFNNGTGSAVEDANGFNYGLGIAPFARMGSTAIFGSTAASPTTWESTAYGQGARISSNSWGFQTATGAPIPRYDTNAQQYDAIVRDAQTGTAGHQQLAVVFAAGNDGSGANTVSTPGTAKNVITVGAGENVRMTGTDGCGIGNTGADSANDVIAFSSRGPVNSAGGDGRVKPEIMGPGTHIEAGVPQSNYNGSSVCNQFFPAGQTLYGWSSGTSHSCPAIAGGAALVYQNFLNQGLAAPSPAMIKAYLVNAATRMTGVGANDTLPSNNQGMGRMDLGRSFDGASRVLVDQTQVLGTTGQTFQVTGSVVNSGLPLRVSLVWTDAPGPTTGAPFVNNLDLEVTVGGTTFRGNVFSGGSSVAGGTADIRNNFESVFLPAGTTGSFTVTVRGTNIAGDGVPGNADTTDQDFALIIYNANQSTAAPTIGVSPASFSFSATAGGANPANQSLSITNTGGGTLNWSASDDAPWLTVAPTSGTAPSSATLSVNTTGLAAGTYNGTITISATGATNTPVSVPVTLTVNPPAAPTIGVSPTSFSFTATAGGANPANQSLNISNTGGGTLSWSAADDATWLTVSPTSGTAPSTATVSVNITGLAAGTFNGTITISATGATNTPVSVPVTLTVNPQSTELIVNGGFEGSSAPWVLSGNAVRSTGAFPHSGTGYLIVASANSQTGQAFQQITIPSGSAPSLNFWLNVTSSETTTTTQFDRLFIEVRSTSGALLATIATFSNLNKGTAGVYVLRGPFNLSAFAGQTVRIQFRATEDFSLPTSFRVDDVSVK